VSSSIAANQTILVVGGGISGMTAALEAAEKQGTKFGVLLAVAERSLRRQRQAGWSGRARDPAKETAGTRGEVMEL